MHFSFLLSLTLDFNGVKTPPYLSRLRQFLFSGKFFPSQSSAHRPIHCVGIDSRSHLVFNADPLPCAAQQHRQNTCVRPSTSFTLSLVFDSSVRIIASIQFKMMWKKLEILFVAMNSREMIMANELNNRVVSMREQLWRLYFRIRLTLDASNTQW